MLPSLLARDIQQGLKQFLVSSFEPADTFMHGLMGRFVEDESAWLKGPYVQMGLPFVKGSAGTRFFNSFETEHPGFSHQEQAWTRLSSQHLAASTLVATGTGSGKTECFLYPVLDHCARERAAGKQGSPGIKALVIYPMNALATDQARRIAALVAQVPAFQGLRVGLYVGGTVGKPGEGMVMTPANVITDRDTLRKHPPDILLTNYKMLDYLMLRPRDRQLWAHNSPTTLRYVVVDELHTFDGAQGTDLALLLRRLRARLKADKDQLICTGTSATLGGSSDTAPLREYARQVFGVPFAADAVVTESRLTVDAFLGEATVDYMFIWQPELDSVLAPALYATPAAAVRAWFSVFFPGLNQPADDAEVGTQPWRLPLPVGGYKSESGQWNTAGHADRIGQITAVRLAAFALLYDEEGEGTPSRRPRLPAMHAGALSSVLVRLVAFPDRLASPGDDHYLTVMFDETFERDIWYDINGRIIFTNSKGLIGVGLPRRGVAKTPNTPNHTPDGKVRERNLAWEGLYKDGEWLEPDGTVVTQWVTVDTLHGGQRTVGCRYVAPFAHANREEDYRMAWAFFEAECANTGRAA